MMPIDDAPVLVSGVQSRETYRGVRSLIIDALFKEAYDRVCLLLVFLKKLLWNSWES